MSLFGGNNATQNSRILGYRVSTSIAGSVIKIVFGTARIPGNVIWTGDWKANKADGKASKGKYGGSYTYQTAGQVALCRGPIPGIVAVWQNQTKNGSADTSWLNATSIDSLGLTALNGDFGQAPWSYLTTNHPDQALGYSDTALVCKPDWDLGTSGVMPNYSYEVTGLDVYSGKKDALATDCIKRLLTDDRLGAGFTEAEVDVSEAENYCLVNGVFISPVLDQQRPASEWISQLLLVANAEAVWSEGVLKIRSRGDTAREFFTPNVTPVIDLTTSDFKDKEEPVRIQRADPRDAPNSLKLNWTNRDNQYNTEPFEAQDQALIDTYGPKPATPVDALGITSAALASQIANLELKRRAYFRARYKFKLGFEHIALEPMDVVTLTVEIGGTIYQGLDHTRARMLSIAEDGDGYLDCEAEEMPQGASNPVTHPAQKGGGFSAPTNATPGDINEPIFYEAAAAQTETLGVPYALLIGLSGGPYWGGCTVWRSWDGTTYEAVGRQFGASKMGTLSDSLPTGSDPDETNTCSVDLLESFGTLASVSTDDADAFKSLCLVEDELISYETADLTAAYNYDLTYLRRGVYGSPVATHASGSTFLVMDKQCFEWDYQLGDIGKTVYFKFTSFNTYGAGEQALADATPYPYTLVGGLSGSIDETPTGAMDGSNTTFTLSFTPNPPESLWLELNGIFQDPGIDFTLSGNTITFTVAPKADDWMVARYSH
jgi:hypothetical protein